MSKGVKWVYEDELPGDFEITPGVFAESRVVYGVRMYPVTVGNCRKCGDPLCHDDDGPILCRFCSQGQVIRPGMGGTTSIEV